MSIATNGKTRLVDARGERKSSKRRQPSRGLNVSRYLGRKIGVERVLAAMLLVPGIPIIGALILLVRCSSRGAGIYRQRRVGKQGKPFTMYKIRTMCCDAEAKTGAQWCTGSSDPRVTKIGRFIRRSHLDEFPQLFNVLRGEMSMIGPRPERPEFVGVLRDQIADYDLRHFALPGITGLAQLNLPPDTDVASVRRKLALDLDYLEHASWILDLRIFLCTFMRLLGFSGDTSMTIMRLHWSADKSAEERPAEVANDRFLQLTPATIVVQKNMNGAATEPSQKRDSRRNGGSFPAQLAGPAERS